MRQGKRLVSAYVADDLYDWLKARADRNMRTVTAEVILALRAQKERDEAGKGGK